MWFLERFGGVPVVGVHFDFHRLHIHSLDGSAQCPGNHLSCSFVGLALCNCRSMRPGKGNSGAGPPRPRGRATVFRRPLSAAGTPAGLMDFRYYTGGLPQGSSRGGKRLIVMAPPGNSRPPSRKEEGHLRGKMGRQGDGLPGNSVRFAPEPFSTVTTIVISFPRGLRRVPRSRNPASPRQRGRGAGEGLSRSVGNGFYHQEIHVGPGPAGG